MAIIMSENELKIRKLIQDLVGEEITLPCVDNSYSIIYEGDFNIGFSQMNELLLLHGFDRVSKPFFQFLVDQTTDYKPTSKVTSLEQFEKGIVEFRKIAILFWGNIKKGFKVFGREPSEAFIRCLKSLKEIDTGDYSKRHNPILPTIPIGPMDTYYLGYIIERELKEKLKDDPENQGLLQQDLKRQEIIKIGQKNQRAYLSSDHLDIYVATSMRLKHEYLFVNKTIKNIFQEPSLSGLNLRWFDPTQAYCRDRIDKGLSEGLMLKRAKCTLYLAQESDTLGKDSELATTLAQGKPVVAYIPEGNKSYVDELLADLQHTNSHLSEKKIILSQLEVFKPSLAWGNDPDSKVILEWINNLESADVTEMRQMLYAIVSDHYEKRASTLKQDHPLGLQVNLDTGVATGVLVVRSVKDCASLLRSIVLKKIIFKLRSEKKENEQEYTYLVEDISGSIFRVMSGDKLLTNAFWNFYLETNQT
jgi:hypothetical protein